MKNDHETRMRDTVIGTAVKAILRTHGPRCGYKDPCGNVCSRSAIQLDGFGGMCWLHQNVYKGIGPMKPLTFEDWQLAGFQVRKGEKASGRNKEGKPTFIRSQVEDKDEPADPHSEPREED